MGSYDSLEIVISRDLLNEYNANYAYITEEMKRYIVCNQRHIFINVDMIPTEDILIDNINFFTVTEQIINIKLEIRKKIGEINKICSKNITNGIDYKGEHFSYTLEDQNNIDNLLSMAQTSNMSVPYHADGMNCKLYSVEDVLAIYIAQKSNITHHTTYSNQLKQYVNTLTTKEDIEAVTYGQPLEGEYLKTYNTMMLQAQAIIDTITTKTAS